MSTGRGTRSSVNFAPVVNGRVSSVRSSPLELHSLGRKDMDPSLTGTVKLLLLPKIRRSGPVTVPSFEFVFVFAGGHVTPGRV